MKSIKSDIPIEDGYRLLAVGDKIKQGDRMLYSEEGRWGEIYVMNVGLEWRKGLRPMARMKIRNDRH